MALRTYGMLNLGRDKKPGTTQRIDRAALTKLRNAILAGRPLADVEAAAFLVEINEGDDNNELAESQDVFTGWRCFGERVHEPLFLTPKMGRGAFANVHRIDGTAVEHWSPERTILAVERDGDIHNDDDYDEVLLAVHYPAGAYGQGDRPKRYQPALNKSWDRVHEAHMDLKRTYHAQGYQVTEMVDANSYELPGMPGEVTVVHERTDYGRVWAARGYEARFRAGRSLPVGLDSHGIHLMRGTYSRA